MTRANKPILIILHRSQGSTGKIGTLLQSNGYTLDIRCIIEGDALPPPENYLAVIVFGGVMSVNDVQEIPAIQHEIEWIPSVINAGIPYLGICLGAQLLATALGASVARKPDASVEIGFYDVRPTKKYDNLLPENGIRFYHWHLEGFTLPERCEHLAESDNFPNQAFRLNKKTIGLQFHPETTRELIDTWVQRQPQHLSLPGAQSYKTQIELLRESEKVVDEWLPQFLQDWLAQA